MMKRALRAALMLCVCAGLFGSVAPLTTGSGFVQSAPATPVAAAPVYTIKPMTGGSGFI